MDISYYKQYEPICGKWYLTNEIGRGAFGVVFEAERRDIIKEKAAVKVVSIPSSQSEVESFRQDHYTLDEKSVTSYFYGFVEEFLKEIKTMALFQDHSNVVNIKDYEVRQRKDEIGWDIFIIMELLTPANKYFAENGIAEGNVIKFGIDICCALEECKKQNIIHRDIKPSNIFVSSNGDFKLGDFGVARTLEKTSSGFSKKGTYTYMAPEVYKGEDYDSSIDIYSLGIVMYKLLNNNLEPFKTGNSFADEENALIRRMKGEKIADGPANASKELAAIILKACSYDPEHRYNSPYDMRVALESLNIKDLQPKTDFHKEIEDVWFEWNSTLMNSNRISSFLLTYGDFPIVNIKYENDKLTIFNKIDGSMDGCRTLPKDLFVEKSLELTNQEINTIEEKLRSINFEKWSSKTHVIENYIEQATGFCIHNLFECTFYNGTILKCLEPDNDEFLDLVSLLKKIVEEKDSTSQTYEFKSTFCNKNIEELELSVATFNRLKRGGFNTVDDLCQKTASDIASICNLGQSNLDEVRCKLESLGLTLKDDSNFKKTKGKSSSKSTALPKGKKKGLAMFLTIFPYTSVFGVHDFYLGNKRRAILKLCTLNFVTIGWLFDVVMVLIGKYDYIDKKSK